MAFFRFLFRLVATALLAVAVIMAVLDATRTIAASALVLTPLSESWAAVSPSTLAGFRAFVAGRLHPALWDPVIVTLVRLPGFVVFGVVATILFGLGRRPDPVDSIATA